MRSSSVREHIFPILILLVTKYPKRIFESSVNSFELTTRLGFIGGANNVLLQIYRKSWRKVNSKNDIRGHCKFFLGTHAQGYIGLGLLRRLELYLGNMAQHKATG